MEYAAVVGVARRIVAICVVNWPGVSLIVRRRKDIDNLRKVEIPIAGLSEDGEWAKPAKKIKKPWLIRVQHPAPLMIV